MHDTSSEGRRPRVTMRSSLRDTFLLTQSIIYTFYFFLADISIGRYRSVIVSACPNMMLSVSELSFMEQAETHVVSSRVILRDYTT